VKALSLVLDKNIYLSALLFGGNPRFIVESAFVNGHIVYISEEIYTEMRRVVTKKFIKFLPEYEAFEVFLRTNAVTVQLGSISIDVCRDDKDNIILETASLSECEYIITGDEGLLSLSRFKKISIVKPVSFIKLNIL
jgi:hypothetical protein